MACELVTGHAAKLHVTAAQTAAFNQGFIGKQTCLLDTKKKLAASILTANKIRIETGDIFAQGRHIAFDTVTDVQIDSGTQGKNRIDLIVCRYTKDAHTGVESTRVEVIKGTPASEPSVPAHTEGVIDEGALVVDFPLYKVSIENLTPLKPVILIAASSTLESVAGKTNETKDWVVDSGVSGIWRYEKWHSGVAKIWGDTEKYQAKVGLFTQEIPTPFVFTQRFYATISNTINNGWAGTMPPYDGADSLNSVKIVSRFSNEGPASFFIMVQGRWK